MTLYLLTGGLISLIGAAGWLWWRSYRSGKRDGRLQELDRGIQGLDAARKAVDAARRDPTERQRLRDKYRVG